MASRQAYQKSCNYLPTGEINCLLYPPGFWPSRVAPFQGTHHSLCDTDAATKYCMYNSKQQTMLTTPVAAKQTP